MQNLNALGLVVCVCSSQPNESRLELRLAATEKFVAWFQVTRRVSKEEYVTSVNTQFVSRKELSAEQIAAVTEWLLQQVHFVL